MDSERMKDEFLRIAKQAHEDLSRIVEGWAKVGEAVKLAIAEIDKRNGSDDRTS
jgi:hypothetical protein